MKRGKKSTRGQKANEQQKRASGVKGTGHGAEDRSSAEYRRLQSLEPCGGGYRLVRKQLGGD